MYINPKPIFNPKDYNLDFLKEKIKPLIYYLYSSLGEKDGNWRKFVVFLEKVDGFSIYPRTCSIDVIEIKNIYCYFNVLSNRDYSFLSEIDFTFDWQKSDFCQLKPITPFRIRVEIVKRWRDEENEEERDEESGEESKEKQPIINIDKTFKLDECVICLTNLPNVLLCNSGHIAICLECNKLQNSKSCPVCKTVNPIKRIV